MTDDRITAHADLVYSTCLRLTGNPQDAADVSQEVFIAWMRHQGRIRGPLAAWLHGTARRRSLDWLRRQHRRSKHEGAVPLRPAATEPAESFIPELDAALAALDSRCRTLVLEHHVLGCTQPELAQRFCLSQTTVSRLISSGIAKLRQHLLRQGVSAVIAATLPAALASCASCPERLLEPLHAQASVRGVNSLLQAGRFPSWWGGWLAGAAIIAATITLLGISGLLAWRLQVTATNPDDVVAAVVARLPPAPAMTIVPTTGVPRYRSIEALIARLPAHDPTVRDRIRDWLREDESVKPWNRLGLTPRLRDLSSTDSRDGFPQPAVGELVVGDRKALSAAEPLLAMLATPGSLLMEGAWLAKDYRAGRFRWWGDIQRAVASEPLADQRYLLHALARRSMISDNPEDDLRQITALVTASQRGACSLLSAMYANALASERDTIYVRLAVRGLLSEKCLRDWCGEEPIGNAVVAQGLTGEPLLLMLPQHEDGLRWGTATLDEHWNPEAKSTPNVWDWSLRPWITRWTVHNITTQERFSAALAGHDRFADISRMADSGSLMARLTFPGAVASAGGAARHNLAHAGKRLLVWMIHLTRQGQGLPESLDEVVDAVARGRELLGGSDLCYGMTYQRLTTTRFRLAIDPHGRSPLYADPVQLSRLKEGTRVPVDPPPPVLLEAWAWEADIERLGEPSAAHFGLNEDREPLVRPVSN
jgi:RNA polymerase sigma factor (sigma-70 family)